MAYTELTCDDVGLSLNDLYIGSLRKMGDGSFAQQVIAVTDPETHIAQYQFILGDTSDIVATVGDDMVQVDGGSQFTSMSAGTVTNTNYSAYYEVVWDAVVKMTIKSLNVTDISSYPIIFECSTGGGYSASIYPNGSVILQYGAGYMTLAPAGSVVEGVTGDLELNMSEPIGIITFYGTQGGSFGELTIDGSVVPAGAIAPADVTIVLNSSDASSAAMATAYATAHGIYVGNIITVDMGSGQEATTTNINDARSAIATAGRQYTVLAMAFPSRNASGQSITSCITYGERDVMDLTESTLYGYTGLKPFDDKGVRPSMLLISSDYIMDSVVLNSGTSYSVLAKDGISEGNPRGSARAAQTAAGLVVFDARSNGSVAEGSNECNQISMTCAAPGYPVIGDVCAVYQSD